MILRTLCVVAVFGFLSESVRAADEATPARLMGISLMRLGDGTETGPQDTLELRGNGTAYYTGAKNVERIGLYSGEIPNHGFERTFPLLEKMYESLRGRPRSIGKPTQGVTAIRLKVRWEGRNETIDDRCPGMDLSLWAFEMAVQGVGADVRWKPVAFEKAWPEQAASRPAAVELKLTPSAAAPDNSVMEGLTANAWLLPGPVNIKGDGFEKSLFFTKTPRGGLEAESVVHYVKGFGRNDTPANVRDRTETNDCQIRGPILWIGGRPQTFALVKGEALVINALVPADKEPGKSRWYYVASERKDGRIFDVEEYVFDFTDDPMNHDAGKVAVTARIGEFPPKSQDMRFSLTRADKVMRYLQIDLDTPNGPAHRARIALVPGKEYGLMLDNPNLDTVIWTAVPAEQHAKPGQREKHAEAPPAFDHQKAAEQTVWHWDADATDPLRQLHQQGSKYDIQMSSDHADRFTVHYRISLGGKPRYEWDGHAYSVFRILDDRLYYVRFGGGPGGIVVAVDLSSGKQLWESPLKAVPVTWQWSKYITKTNLSASSAGVFVYGWEPAGRYFEDKDPNTGRTVGHKVFDPVPP